MTFVGCFSADVVSPAGSGSCWPFFLLLTGTICEDPQRGWCAGSTVRCVSTPTRRGWRAPLPPVPCRLCAASLWRATACSESRPRTFPRPRRPRARRHHRPSRWPHIVAGVSATRHDRQKLPRRHGCRGARSLWPFEGAVGRVRRWARWAAPMHHVRAVDDRQSTAEPSGSHLPSCFIALISQ